MGGGGGVDGEVVTAGSGGGEAAPRECAPAERRGEERRAEGEEESLPLDTEPFILFRLSSVVTTKG